MKDCTILYIFFRGRYEKEGLPGLEEELRMELLRISERNLGRDNRIVSNSLLFFKLLNYRWYRSEY